MIKVNPFVKAFVQFDSYVKEYLENGVMKKIPKRWQFRFFTKKGIKFMYCPYCQKPHRLDELNKVHK